MKNALVLAAGLASCSLSAQLNIQQLGHLDYQALRSSNLSNLWGYTDELGNEYALVGVNGSGGNTGGLSIVNINDPANPQEVFFTPGPTSIWREIKVWNDHAYMTTEATQGLTIVDLSPLPQSNVLPVTVFQGNGWITSHSLFIDENGRLYVNGSNRGNGGCIFYDLTQNPMVPVEVGQFDQWYVHDCFARGNILYAAHIIDGFFSIVDVSDPANPLLLGTRTTPTTFTHNCWLDDTGNYLFTTDETVNSFVASYDVTDPTDINELDRLQTAPGSNAIVHNTYWLNDYVVQSYYTEGVSIYDVTNPHNMVEVGHYDTSPISGGTFNGAWGVYPFLPSGNLIVSDIEGGLYILGPNYVRGCYLEGTITDAQSNLPINGASITLVATTAFAGSAFDGHYATGWAVPGTYDLLVHKAGYVDQTISGVNLATGATAFVDVALVPITQFSYSGTVVTAGTAAPITGASVVLIGGDTTFTATTDADGHWTVPSMYTGNYMITAGQWGFHTNCLPTTLISENNLAMTIELTSGYADDFALDLGWSATATASSGLWVRDVPIGTDYNGQPCAPDVDLAGDCAGMAYVTGNGGQDAGNDDVDGGEVVLTSPVFDLSDATDPWVRYHRWFFNGGGSGTPDDICTISIANGLDTMVIETIDAGSPGAHTWQMRQFDIASFLTPTATMRFIVRTADTGQGHLVEAALDGFEILPESPFLGVQQTTTTAGLRVYPNPSLGEATVEVNGAVAQVTVLDACGREVLPAQWTRNGKVVLNAPGGSGLYLVRAVSSNGEVRTTPWLVR